MCRIGNSGKSMKMFWAESLIRNKEKENIISEISANDFKECTEMAEILTKYKKNSVPNWQFGTEWEIVKKK